jgi:formate hydrogenlyase transcriptional activator
MQSGGGSGNDILRLTNEEEVRKERNFGEIVGESAQLRQVLKEVETVAPTGSTVLVRGETGTGKELIVRALHELSPRRDRAFVKLNCAAIPSGLLESELFGHEKGAFTGAISQKAGRFQLAHQGTLFLDEVGDVPPELQPKLLRVLQEQEFERLGGTTSIKVDVRLVAATNCDLAALVADGRFRSDLYYRLNVFPIVLPPLRERQDDIPRLVRHFTQQFAGRLGRRIETIPTSVMEALVHYPWPGNIRELQNVLERAVILSPGPVLHINPDDLKPSTTARVLPPPPPLLGKCDCSPWEEFVAHELSSRPPRLYTKALTWMERSVVALVLQQTLGNQTAAADILGITRASLRFKIRKLGIDVEEASRTGASWSPEDGNLHRPSDARPRSAVARGHTAAAGWPG